MGKKRRKKFVIGICPECKVREGDSSKKRLYKCRYCGRYFCKKHLPPRLAVMRSAIEEIKDPVLKDKVYKEWRKPDGHPDWVWTKKYFQELKMKEEEEREKFFELLDKWKEKERKPLPPLKPKLIPSFKFPLTYSLRKIFWGMRISLYSLIRNFIIIFTILCVLHFLFLHRINFQAIFYRSTIFLITGYFLWFIYQKTRRFIPYKWFIVGGIVVSILYFYSAGDFSQIKVMDKILGINGFVDSLKTKISQFSTSVSRSNVVKIPTEPSHIKVCRERAKEYIENLRLKSPVDFNYNILEVREFLTPDDAEIFAKNKVSSFSYYKICRQKMISFKYVPIKLPSKIIAIIYEVRFTTPAYTCVFGFCGTIEKFTDVIYCGDDGRILEKGITSSCI